MLEMTLYIQAQFPFFILKFIIYHLEFVFITFSHFVDDKALKLVYKS